MKKGKSLIIFRRFFRKNILVVIGLIGVLSSCIDDKIVNINTYTNEMMGDYLKNNPTNFSEFTRMLDTTKVMGLLQTYGEYTCFAPTNKALFKYYKSKGRTSLKDFPLDTIKMIVYNHLIKGDIYTSSKFNDGRLASTSMNQRYISISSGNDSTGTLFFTVNKTSVILIKDHLVNNGVVHMISEMINPTQLTSVAAIEADKRFTLFYSALQQTGLAELLIFPANDASYHPDDYKAMIAKPFTQGGGSVDELPQYKKNGFTILMESDSTFKYKYGIETVEQLKVKAAEIYDAVYPEDAGVTDITDRRNSLNRFVAYHMINKQLSYNQFIKAYDTDHMIKSYDMFEYIETMCPNTLIEVRLVRPNNGVNLFNMINTPDNAVKINMKYYDKDATNGVYHEIDRILAYNTDVLNHMSNIRLRMDAASFFPELTNNNMRGNGKVQSWVFPRGYIKRLTCSELTTFTYLNSYGGYLDYEGDEVYLKGLYDFSVVTPPIPKGVYEVRFGYQPTPGRGVAQLYFDSIPCGIPLDLRNNADNALIGYQTISATNLDDPFGYENDKMMRNRGYMKGPSSYQDFIDRSWGYGFKQPARNNVHVLRKVLGIYNFDKPGNHVFTVKSVYSGVNNDGQFMFDYLEFIPVELIPTEGVD